MRTEILQEAEDELNEAIAHYEDVEAGLGQRTGKAETGKLKAEVASAFRLQLSGLSFHPSDLISHRAYGKS